MHIFSLEYDLLGWLFFFCSENCFRSFFLCCTAVAGYHESRQPIQLEAYRIFAGHSTVNSEKKSAIAGCIIELIIVISMQTRYYIYNIHKMALLLNCVNRTELSLRRGIRIRTARYNVCDERRTSIHLNMNYIFITCCNASARHAAGYVIYFPLKINSMRPIGAAAVRNVRSEYTTASDSICNACK